MANHLTGRDRDLVRCVVRHRVLTTGQLAALDLQIATAAIDPARACPAGPVWMTLHGGHGPMRLIDLGTVPYQ